MSNPSSEGRDDLPRISIETIKDWEKIKTNFSEAVQTCLDEIISSGRSSHVREAVSAHLTEWQSRLVDAASRNVRVNGHNLEGDGEIDRGTEMFDEVLDRRIWSLSEERIAWDKTLSQRRRQAPAQVEALLTDLLERQDEAESQHHPALTPLSDAVPERSLQNLDNISGVQAITMELVSELNTTVPQLVERAERGQMVIQDVAMVE
ncbi:hypothetical protein SISNIDRAFT_448240 [Sistotremastrum niveocremeum HHB9708]|uniref:Uncharacterized protein n=2 Tax=Sistotremastraceae TaxID=3402574 RepID=A0A165ANC6_9AGAM|nr:hypothetical protein SISNIDRAFT_448240 [Sistotremastrum niveocremeum HHB9708]KZT37005.1 hypothetical protein SISSUDRAFT_1049136 [Sistotremastrum suecicum HHB10207 ss-3]